MKNSDLKILLALSAQAVRESKNLKPGDKSMLIETLLPAAFGLADSVLGDLGRIADAHEKQTAALERIAGTLAYGGAK